MTPMVSVEHPPAILGRSNHGGTDLREFAGLVEWMAGVTIQLKPFVWQLWAAMFSKGADHHRVYEQQVHGVLTWIHTLFKDRSKMMATRFLQPPSTQTVIVCDASPTGGGAVVYFIEASMEVDLKMLASQAPMAWMA